jgi:hypothetical protein
MSFTVATTKDGTEFYLAEISPATGDADMARAKKTIEGLSRRGDAVFEVVPNLYLAIVSDVPGAGIALRRLITNVRQNDLDVKVRLVTEPFPEQLAEVASKVIMGQVEVSRRPAGRRDASVDDVFEVEVKPDQG